MNIIVKNSKIKKITIGTHSSPIIERVARFCENGNIAWRFSDLFTTPPNETLTYDGPTVPGDAPGDAAFAVKKQAILKVPEKKNGKKVDSKPFVFVSQCRPGRAGMR